MLKKANPCKPRYKREDNIKWIIKKQCESISTGRIFHKVLHRFFKTLWDETFTDVIQLKSLLNPLKPELNPICYLLALLGAHHFLHVSRIRVRLLTLR